MRRIILGKRGGDVGLWISRPGFDALTATDPGDFMVMPGFVFCKPYMTGVVTQIVGQYTVQYGGTTPVYGYKQWAQATVAHNLGYTPVAIAFGQSGGYRACASVDTQNLYLSVPSALQNGATANVNFPYAIFLDPLP